MAIYICTQCSFSKNMEDIYIDRRLKCPECKSLNKVISSSTAPSNSSAEPTDPPAFLNEAPVQPLSIVCPFCQTSLSVSPSQAGLTVACPKCEGNFQVPLPTANVNQGGGSYYSSNQGPANGTYNNADVQRFASKKIAAGICGILLGCLGVHKFILGFGSSGAIMLSVSLLGFFTGLCIGIPLLAWIAMIVIGLAEGIIYLTKSDEEFYQAYAVEKREWF